MDFEETLENCFPWLEVIAAQVHSLLDTFGSERVTQQLKKWNATIKISTGLGTKI